MADGKKSGGAGGFSAEELGAYWTLARSMFRRGALNRSNLELLGRTAMDGFNQAGGVSGLRSMAGEKLRAGAPSSPPSPLRAKAKPALPPNHLTGTVLVPGRADGTARIVSAAGPGSVASGEILVCGRLEPQWMEGIERAAALVVETGAPAARAIRLARQHNIPTVRLAGARRLIPDRTRLSVIGETGTVIITAGAG